LFGFGHLNAEFPDLGHAVASVLTTIQTDGLATPGNANDLRRLPILRMVVLVSRPLRDQELQVLQSSTHYHLGIPVAPSLVFKFRGQRIVRHSVHGISETDWLELAIGFTVLMSGRRSQRSLQSLNAATHCQFCVLVAPSLILQSRGQRIVLHSISDGDFLELALGFGFPM
jgi:hypothetical protein